MVFGSKSRQTCTVIFAPRSCKPQNLNSPMGALCLCVASFPGFPSKEIQAGRRTGANSRFAVKAAQTQLSCLWRVSWALIATTKGSTSSIQHQGLWQGFNIEKGGGEWGIWCKSLGMLTAKDQPTALNLEASQHVIFQCMALQGLLTFTRRSKSSYCIHEGRELIWKIFVVPLLHIEVVVLVMR